VKEQMLDWWGPVVHEYYAGSEALGFVAIGPQEWRRHRGSVGRSLRGPVHILDDDGHEVPAGTSGTIWFEGVVPFAYHGDPDKTSAAFNDRGYATLGDVGYLSEDGYLYLTDRATDLIIVGGVNVYPQEIERVLLLHEAVVDAGAIGAPDADLGEVPAAFVQTEGAQSAELAAELLAFARERLGTLKAPRTLTFVEQMPRLPTGKLLRRRLRELDRDAGAR
jgi:acyl-CoA synthetase (AMP-forming)/AMP-acid ligase II